MKKMTKYKHLTIGFLVGALFFSGVSYAATGSLKIVQNGIDKTPTASDLKPTIQNGRVLLPVRAAADLLGVNLAWDNATKTVTIGEKIKGTPVKGIAAFSGEIRSVTYPSTVAINKKSYSAPSIVLYQRLGIGEFKINLNGKYNKFTFSLGIDDKSDKDASINLVFKDENGRLISENSIGYNGLDEAITLDVTNVTQLVVTTNASGFYSETYAALINPVLQ